MRDAKISSVVLLVLSAAVIIVWPTAAAATSMSFSAGMEPNNNEFLAREGWYIVSTFLFATDDKDLCSSNTCTYTIDNGQFTPNTFTHGFTFEGNLKVSLPRGPQGITSKFYPLRIDLDKTGSVENTNGGESKRVDSLSGIVKLGSNVFSPDFKYKTINANLVLDNGISSNPVLKIKAERCFLC